MRATRSIAALLLIPVLLLGCSDDDDDDADEADAATEQADLCNQRLVLSDGLSQLQAADTGSMTIADAQGIADQVRDQIQSVSSAAQDVAEAELQDVEDAYDDLAETIDGVEDDQTLDSVKAELETQAQAVEDAWAALFAAADCPEAP